MTGFPKPTPRYFSRLQRKRDRDKQLNAARAVVKERDGGKCRACGKTGPTEAHHVVYRSHGGTDTASNLVSLCAKCHSAVHGHALKITGQDAATARVEWVGGREA